MFTIDMTPEELATMRLMVKTAISAKVGEAIDHYTTATVLLHDTKTEGQEDLRRDLMSKIAKLMVFQQELDTPLLLAAIMGRKLVIPEQGVMTTYTNIASSVFSNGAPKDPSIAQGLAAILTHQPNILHKFKAAAMANMPTNTLLLS